MNKNDKMLHRQIKKACDGVERIQPREIRQYWDVKLG